MLDGRLRARRDQSEQDSKPPALPIQRLLDIDADDNAPHDVLEPHSQTTASTIELGLRNLLGTIEARKIKAVAISALDSLDAIFLAQQVKTSFPDVTLVFLSADVLLFSGTSALTSLVVLAVGYSIWCLGYLQQAAFAHDFRSRRRSDIEPASQEHRLASLADGRWPTGLALLSLTLCGLCALCWSFHAPVLDGTWFRVLAALLFSVLFSFTLFGGARSCSIWHELQRFIEHNGDRFEVAIRDVPQNLLRRLCDANNPHVERLYHPGRLVAVIISYSRAQLLALLRSTTLCTLFLILASTLYPFKTQRTLTAAILAFAGGLIVLVVSVYLRMARCPHLSRLQGTREDKNPLFDPTLLRGLLLHGVLPVAALLAVRFPEFGRLLLGWWEPLTFALGK